jgi:isoleucyl-tRNA synthetase
MYRAVGAWFINVQAIKEDLIKNNKDPKWVPEEI